MRRLFALALALAPLGVAAQDHWVESAVTVSLTLTSAKTPRTIPGSGERATEIADLQTVRIGNKDILLALVENGDIAETKGWRVVAVWANWPDEDPVSGNSYRFYAKRGKGATAESVAIPSSLFSHRPIEGAYGYRVTFNDEAANVGGKENYQVFSDTKFEVASTVGHLFGLRAGSGRYVRVKGESEARYLPDSSRITGGGVFSEDGETTAGVVGGTVSFGAGALVLSPEFTTPEGAVKVQYTPGGSVSVVTVEVTVPDVDTSVSPN